MKARQSSKVARYALLASVVAHACALWWLALVVAHEPLGGLTTLPGEMERIAPIATLERRPLTAARHAPRSHAARGAVIHRRAIRPSRPAPPPLTARDATSRAEPATSSARLPRVAVAVVVASAPARARPSAAATSRPVLALTPIPAASATTPAATLTPPPTPMPTTAPMTAAPSSRAGGFNGLFSQNYPPALPSHDVVDTLHAQLGQHFHIRIRIDESGHATEIQFLEPVDDPAVAESVRLQLARLHYVPADCNGLHCEGVLELAS